MNICTDGIQAVSSPKLPGRAISLAVEPANICNLRCSCCPHGDVNAVGRPKGKMSRGTFTTLFNNIDIPVRHFYLYAHGEPFLNDDLGFFLEILDKETKVVTKIFSNGYNIDIALLNEVLVFKKTLFSFSMDLVHKEHYEGIRTPAKYENALQMLKTIDEVFARHKRTFELNMIIELRQWEEVSGIQERFFLEYKQLGKLIFSTKFPWPEHFYTGELAESLFSTPSPCSMIRDGLTVFWNGEVSVCRFDYSGRLIAGNLLERKLSEIQNSPMVEEFRTAHQSADFKNFSLCRHCLIPRFKFRNLTFRRTQLKKQT